MDAICEFPKNSDAFRELVLFWVLYAWSSAIFFPAQKNTRN
jgi:hypothetical protein